MVKPFVFTLMPFEKSFDDVYKIGIKATCEELNSYCERVDEQIFQGSILDRIFNQISKADVIIADMSGRNPNVFFEVGFANALGKKLILLTKSTKDIPFDLKHFTHIVYDNSIINLKKDLKKHLNYYLSNLDKKQSELYVGVNLYVCGVRLVEGETTTVEIPSSFRRVPLTIENISGAVIENNGLQITASHTEKYSLLGFKQEKDELIGKDNKRKWTIYNNTPIFHGAEKTFELDSIFRGSDNSKSVQISVFTRNGMGNYILEHYAQKK